MFYSGSYFVYMIPAFLLMLAAQWYVNSAYKRWSKIPNERRMTGAEAVQKLTQYAGLGHIGMESSGGRGGLRLEQVGGRLTDHYDPRTKTLRLSPGVAQGASVAALAIAAHELGHALQDNEDYFMLRLRGAMVPVVNIGSYMGWIFILAGLFLNMTNLAWLGLIIFSGGALFALATLPVEFDASARAKQMLTDSGIIMSDRERRGVNTVLNAAALTYVAALVTAVLQLLYYASLIMGRRD